MTSNTSHFCYQKTEKEGRVLKKLVLIAVALLFALFATANSSLAKIHKVSKKAKFIVTAYYKPLPKQKKYATGSYKGDLRLNGTGRTFSEEEVRDGDAAADLRVLPLGTFVNVPGHKIVRIKDIGGDIKGKRLDIFMGEGEEGLTRALEWGKKLIIAEVIKWGDQ
jgi:3D (Asp-Asp-Asp) domain-containing protein